MSVCASCGAEILWRNTPAGKAMPIDAEPASDGNVLVSHSECLVLGPLEIEKRTLKQPLFKSHFATCPNATKHRKAAA